MGEPTYTLVLRVVDSNNEPVPFALLRLRQTGNTQSFDYSCGPDGRFTLDLSAGQYTIETFFMGASVAHSSLRLPGISVYDIVAKVFSLRVYVTDQGSPISNAIVRAYASTEEWREATTDISGLGIFKQLPGTTISISIFKNGKRMGDGMITLMDRNDAISIERAYYYTVRFRAIDKDKRPASNVMVRMGQLFNFTDETGMTTVEVKKGTYNLEMTLYDVSVYSSTLSIAGNNFVNATISASSLLVTLMDETGQPYIGTVIVQTGHTNQTSTTDTTGSIAMKQIPYGEIGISVLPGIVTKIQHEGKQISVSIITRKLRITATPIFAYQLGSMRVRVAANIGDLPLKKTRVSVTSGTNVVIGVTDSTGVAEIDVPLYLENPAIATVRIIGNGQDVRTQVDAGTSPLMLFIVPLGLVPLILFVTLTRMYRQSLSVNYP